MARVVSFSFCSPRLRQYLHLSLHDALPISRCGGRPCDENERGQREHQERRATPIGVQRSEEHTSELQSRQYLVCRLLLEKKEKGRNVRIGRAAQGYVEVRHSPRAGHFEVPR